MIGFCENVFGEYTIDGDHQPVLDQLGRQRMGGTVFDGGCGGLGPAGDAHMVGALTTFEPDDCWRMGTHPPARRRRPQVGICGLLALQPAVGGDRDELRSSGETGVKSGSRRSNRPVSKRPACTSASSNRDCRNSTLTTPSTAVPASARSSPRSASDRSAPCAITLASIGS
jgi:hypothetical protein